MIGEAGEGTEAVRRAAEVVPDVVLMDLAMPGMDGVEATRRIRTLSPRTQVVVLTSYHEDANLPAIKAGAISYLLKDVAPEELAEAIRAAAGVRPSSITRGGTGDGRTARRAGGGPQSLHRPDRPEMDVLRLIAEGLSNAEIAGRLVISEKTVKGYVSNILSKLHLSDRTQLRLCRSSG